MSTRPSRKNRITDQQKKFIIALFCQDLDFQRAMEYARVRERQLDRWLAEPRFIEEFRRRLERRRFNALVDASLILPGAVRSLIQNTYSQQDQISYAATRDLFRAAAWLKKAPQPLGDQAHLPDNLAELDRLIRARADTRKHPA